MNEDLEVHTKLVNSLLLKKNSSLTQEDIEDLTQEVFYNTVLFRDQYDEEKGKFTTWLGLIVRYTYDRYIRGKDVLNINSDLLESDKELYEDIALTDFDEHYYLNNKDTVDYYLDLLFIKQRDKVYMFLILGYTHREIGSSLHITEESSRVLTRAAIKNLEKLIQSDNPEELILKEPEVLKSRYSVPYAGDWAYRLNESPDRSHGMTKKYTPAEVIQYCQDNNIKYKYGETL